MAAQAFFKKWLVVICLLCLMGESVFARSSPKGKVEDKGTDVPQKESPKQQNPAQQEPLQQRPAKQPQQQPARPETVKPVPQDWRSNVGRRFLMDYSLGLTMPYCWDVYYYRFMNNYHSYGTLVDGYVGNYDYQDRIVLPENRSGYRVGAFVSIAVLGNFYVNPHFSIEPVRFNVALSPTMNILEVFGQFLGFGFENDTYLLKVYLGSFGVTESSEFFSLLDLKAAWKLSRFCNMEFAVQPIKISKYGWAPSFTLGIGIPMRF